MRVGIVILPEHRWWVAEPKWRAAEEYGFHHAWTYDHLAWRSLAGGPWFSALPTLTAAAMATDRIRLGTFVASPNFRHPVPFARELLALDDISDGRLTLGIGSGGGGVGGYDSTVLGEPEPTPAHRADRFAEFLTLLDELLRTDGVDYHGDYYRAVGARNLPGCVQRPRVPFLVAANGPRALRLAARYGGGWVTTGPPTESLPEWWSGVAALATRFQDALGEQGRDPATVSRCLSLDAAPVYSLSTVETFTDAVGRAESLGFTDVAVHWPRPEGVYAGHESILETLAADVLPSL